MKNYIIDTFDNDLAKKLSANLKNSKLVNESSSLVSVSTEDEIIERDTFIIKERTSESYVSKK